MTKSRAGTVGAMILAAGRGERMRPLSDTTPKPLLEAGGKPLIVWQIEALARGGFRDIVVNVSHLDVKGKDKPAANSTITATCVATTFVLLEKPAPAKPGAKPAAPAPRPAVSKAA